MKDSSSSRLLPVKGLLVIGILLSAALSNPAMAQEPRYSWMDLSFVVQDIDKMGTLTPIPGQTVDVHGKDGDGVQFRGSVGTWHNLYMFVDYASSDIDVDVVVTNTGGAFSAVDEFDFTDIRGGIGLKWSIGFSTDIYGELSYDSIDFDFGSFAGEDFDTNNQDYGGALGIRSMITDELELRASARYSAHADLELTNAIYDAGTIFGVGFGWEVVKGLSIVGDYESGEFSRISIGFRLDLDED
jgi:hypothetical protein